MSELENYISTYFSVAKDDLEKISSMFRPMGLKKGEFFLKKGHYATKLAFVQSGIVREFVTTDDKEVTKWISTKGYFVVDLASFVFQQPARWNFQALTEVELFAIDLQDYQRISEVIPSWPHLEKLFIAKCFTVLEDRVLQHLSLSAEERYHMLFQYNKALFNEVPLQYLASMLGMAPETLSRMRKKSV